MQSSECGSETGQRVLFLSTSLPLNELSAQGFPPPYYFSIFIVRVVTAWHASQAFD
jgi:hypothetical protein